MNAFYRWLPHGPDLPAHHAEHARSKIQEACPEAHFEPQPDERGLHIIRVWADRAAHAQNHDPIAEITWSS